MDEYAMSPIEEVIKNRKEKAKQEALRKQSVRDMTDTFSRASSHSASTISDELKKGVKVTNFHEAPSPHQTVHIGLHGLEHLDIDTATITGLDDLVDAMLRGLDKIIDKLDRLEITVPPIKIPPITVPPAQVKVDFPKIPEPKVTINVPEPKVIVRENRTIDLPFMKKKEEKPIRLVEEKPIYKNEELDGFIEVYSDGSTIKKTGLSTMKIKYEYGD